MIREPTGTNANRDLDLREAVRRMGRRYRISLGTLLVLFPLVSVAAERLLPGAGMWTALTCMAALFLLGLFLRPVCPTCGTDIGWTFAVTGILAPGVPEASTGNRLCPRCRARVG